MLDNRGEETEDTEGDKTQPENNGGVNVAGGVNMFSFQQNIPEFGDAKPESNQREGGANPRHEGTVGSRTSPLFAKFGGNIHLLRMFIRIHILSLGDQSGESP